MGGCIKVAVDWRECKKLFYMSTLRFVSPLTDLKITAAAMQPAAFPIRSNNKRYCQPQS